MSEQVVTVEYNRIEPIATQQENELICEKLLGWKRGLHLWKRPDGTYVDPKLEPTFTTWAEAGLILDALAALFVRPRLACEEARKVPAASLYRWRCSIGRIGLEHTAVANTAPLAIRETALKYIRSLP